MASLHNDLAVSIKDVCTGQGHDGPKAYTPQRYNYYRKQTKARGVFFEKNVGNSIIMLNFAKPFTAETIKTTHYCTMKTTINKTRLSPLGRLLAVLLLMMAPLAVAAQSADKLYEEGKKLYDAKQYAEAFPKLKAAAEKGHRKAQYRLGRCYDKGRGTKEDNKKAFEWYGKGAAQDHAKSQYQLARCYFKGKGVDRDTEKARTWLQKALKNDKADGKILDEMRQEAAKGDDDAKAMLKLVGKK